MKIRKNHSRKRYRYSVNRKTLRKKQESTGKIQDPILKKHWDERKNPTKNAYRLGLRTDLNSIETIPSYKRERLEKAKIVNKTLEDESEIKKKRIAPKSEVLEELEQKIKEAKKWDLRLPKSVVSNLNYFLDKYKLDYKSMVADKKNYNQWTWKHFRMKIRQYMSIPEQFNKYLEERNLDIIEWDEYESDSEWK